MSPAKRLGYLCVAAIVFHTAGALFAIDPRNVIGTEFGHLALPSLCVVCLVGVMNRSRPARLLFPFTIFLQLGILIEPDWPRTVLSVIGVCISIVILVVIWCSPVKDLFRFPDPDAPVL